MVEPRPRALSFPSFESVTQVAIIIVAVASIQYYFWLLMNPLAPYTTTLL